MRRARTRARSQGGSYAVVRRPERLSTRLWEHGLHVGCHDIASPHSKAIPYMAAVPLQGHNSRTMVVHRSGLGGVWLDDQHGMWRAAQPRYPPAGSGDRAPAPHGLPGLLDSWCCSRALTTSCDPTRVCASGCWSPKPPVVMARPGCGGRGHQPWRWDGRITFGDSKRYDSTGCHRGLSRRRLQAGYGLRIDVSCGLGCSNAGRRGASEGLKTGWEGLELAKPDGAGGLGEASQAYPQASGTQPVRGLPCVRKEGA